jgi:hypothetical protein
MALAHVNRAQGGGSASAGTVASAAANHTAGNLLVAWVTWANAQNFSSIADTAGNTWHLAGSEFNQGGSKHRIYYAYNCNGNATNVVTATFGSNTTIRAIVVHQFSGALATLDPLGDTETNGNVGAFITTTPMRVTSTEEVQVAFMRANSAGIGSGNGTLTTFAVTGDAGQYYADQYKIVTTSGALTATCTSAAWGVIAASFKVAPTIPGGVDSDEIAPYYSISGTFRAAMSRSDYYRPYAQIAIAGTRRSTMVDKRTVRVVQSNDGQANTATFECFDFVPTRGQEVAISVGTAANRIFAGHILHVSQSAPHANQRVRYHVSCVDYHWLLETRRITGRVYQNTSASQIIDDLMLLAPSGFSTNNVQASMPSVDFTANHAETVLQAIRRLMKMVGGYVYVDYLKDVHAFITPETDANPLVVNGSDFDIWDVTYSEDLSQARTRVFVLGGTTQTTSPVPITATAIPVDDTTLFGASGGSALAFGNEITYGATSPTSGVGWLASITGLNYAIPQGESVRVLATQVNSNAASSMAVWLGTEGLIDHVIEDARLSDAGARERAEGDLTLFNAPDAVLQFTTRAKFLRSGKTIVASMSAPAAISGTFLVSHVTIRDLDPGGNGMIFPVREVSAGSASRDVYDLLTLTDRLTTEGVA